MDAKNSKPAARVIAQGQGKASRKENKLRLFLRCPMAAEKVTEN
jgi:hypothetical protein